MQDWSDFKFPVVVYTACAYTRQPAEVPMRVLNAALLILFVAFLSSRPASPQASPALPERLSDAEFWRIFTEFSEPGGDYPYENFVTNEETIQDVMPVLTKVAKPGGVYLGVGPEQNFTYAAGVKPSMAFVFDIRRQNAIEHLMYKALFELSPTRADFVSRLFSIKSPNKVPTTARADSLFLAIDGLTGDKAYYTENLAAIRSTLAKHNFSLNADDLKKVEYIYDVFFRAGPQIDYSFASAFPAGMAPAPNYVQAMTDTDADKKQWSFLATEENYQFIRGMHLRNAFIPIVGDFAGPTAIRKDAAYLKQHNATVSAFYVSNVEVYLEGGLGPVSNRTGNPEKLQRFYDSTAELPIDRSSLFIRFIGAGQATNLKWWRGAWLQAVSPMMDLRQRVTAGSKPTYAQALQFIPDPKTLSSVP